MQQPEDMEAAAPEEVSLSSLTEACLEAAKRLVRNPQWKAQAKDFVAHTKRLGEYLREYFLFYPSDPRCEIYVINW